MINFRNISGLLTVIAMAIYFLFGDPDSYYWTSYDFVIQSWIIFYFSGLLLNVFRDKLMLISLKIIMGTALMKLLFNLYSFYDVDVFNKINRSYESGGIIVFCILIFLIYHYYGMDKREI